MKHTPGPWKLRDNGYEFSKDIVQAKPSEWVINYDVPSDQAEHIVACVNALEGVEDPVEDIETVKDLLYHIKGVSPDSGIVAAATKALSLLGVE